MSGAAGGPLLNIVGATATGKSELAVAVALAVGGEVVNTDAMQVYRGMDVGTAKLTADQWRGVPHHLLDLWDVTHEASVVEFAALARAAVAGIQGRDRLPVLVGGSGLYVRAVVDDLDFPGTDPQVRARLEGELAAAGGPALHARLARLDPQAAAAILPTNGRRVVRALEVVEITGRPFAASLPPVPVAVPGVVQIGLEVPRDVLDERIEQRVDRMWASGLVAEVRRLEARGLRQSRTASRALGYAQVLRHLAGECTEDDARTETIRATRRFARRQLAWFRRDPRIGWLRYDDPDLVGRVVAAVAAR